MATLIHPVAQAADSPARQVPVSRYARLVRAWCLRRLRAGWRRACRHAERPGRVVPYY